MISDQAKYYINKGEQWCNENADIIDWDLFLCDMNTFNQDFADSFKSLIQRYCWLNEKYEYHREDGPAIIHPDGYQSWYLNGRCHREDGPAYINTHGYQAWYLNGKLHREGGPAIIPLCGPKEWYFNGCHHREDGPAIVFSDGTGYWYLNGRKYTQEEWKQKVEKKK